jgi:ABC-type multidrug transport system ATPase subunit
MTSPVRTEKLSKTYEVRARKGLFKSEHRSVEALNSITLEVNQGEVFGLLGPNGAGKTTLIKILTTLLLPTSGSAWINGFNVTQDENKVRGSVGCMLMGERGLYWKLTGRENLEYFGALYHLDPAQRYMRLPRVPRSPELSNWGQALSSPAHLYNPATSSEPGFSFNFPGQNKHAVRRSGEKPGFPPLQASPHFQALASR